MTKAEEILGGYTAGATAAGLQFNCARCGETLTDPASIEHSWGPVCRKLANAAYAACLPADTTAALAALATVPALPGVLADALCAVALEVAAGAAAGRADWRDVATLLIRLVAYGPGAAKLPLCAAVEQLGYGTLAAVAREEASPSVAVVTVVGGRVVLTTKKNPAALVAIKAIAGRAFDGATKTWTFPATALRAVVAVVATYFPTTKLNVLALAAAAAAALPAAKAAPVVTLTPTPAGLQLVTPYNAAFVAELKAALPYQARTWNGAARCWVIAPAALATVQDLVAKHYGVAAAAA